MQRKIDIKKSLEISKLSNCKVGQCYDNIFNLVTEHGFREYFISLGYTLTNSFGMMNRHIWLENNNGVIIDPTYVLLDHNEVSNYKYYSLKKFRVKDYFKSIVEYKDKSLSKICSEEEIKFYKEKDTNYFLKKNGMKAMKGKEIKEFIFINEIDFNYYILPILQGRSGLKNGI